MSQISVQHDQMEVILQRTAQASDDVAAGFGSLPSGGDGGLASDKIAFVLRIALEGAQLAADTATGITAIAGAALGGQLQDEAEIYEALNNFHGKTFD